MNRSRKLISLICALAMMISVFAGFSVAQAEEVTTGIKLVYDAENSTGTKKVVKAQYVGLEGIKGSTVELAIPAELAEKITAINGTSTIAGLTSQSSLDDVKAKNTYVFTAAAGSVAALADNTIVTIEITLSEGNAEEIALDFVTGEAAKTAVDGGTNLWLKKGEIQVAGTTLARDESLPTPKPTAPARPTVAPTEAPVVEVETGIELVYDAENSTDVKKVIKANYVGVEGIKGSTVELAIPAELAEKITAINGTSAIAGLTSQSSLDDVKAKGTYVFTAAAGSVAALEGNTIVTIEITLAEANTAPIALDFVTGEAAKTAVDGGTNMWLKKDEIQVAGVEIPVYGADEPAEPVKTIVLADYVADGAADAATAAEAEGKDVYVTVDVEKKDGTKAVYGSDFTAVYNDKELTEAEFINLISGYTEDSMADVINGLSFNIYNNDVAKVSTTVNAVDAEGNAEMIADPFEKTLAPAKPTPVPKKPTLSATVSKSTVYTEDKGVKITVKVTNPAEDGVLSYEVSGSAVTNIAFDAETGVLTFDGNAKGTANFTFTYTYTDANGETATVTAKKSVTVKVKPEPSTPGTSGTGSGSYSDGPIAGGVTPSTPGMLPNATFTDLGSVAWAQEAITRLAAMGAISGRGNGIFDPNANITRAEYCQILVNAIGKSQESADSNFADVDTNAWYYHSVSVASKYGIVSGYGDGNFGPNNLITRRDMALMTLKAAQVMNVNLTAVRTLTFADADQFDYAADAINTLANAGIINGMSETEFAPLANATRAQAAKIIYDTFVK